MKYIDKFAEDGEAWAYTQKDKRPHEQRAQVAKVAKEMVGSMMAGDDEGASRAAANLQSAYTNFATFNEGTVNATMSANGFGIKQRKGVMDAITGRDQMSPYALALDDRALSEPTDQRLQSDVRLPNV